jgi:hypothetical protein
MMPTMVPAKMASRFLQGECSRQYSVQSVSWVSQSTKQAGRQCETRSQEQCTQLCATLLPSPYVPRCCSCCALAPASRADVYVAQEHILWIPSLQEQHTRRCCTPHSSLLPAHQAFGVTPAGAGHRAMATPTPMQMACFEVEKGHSSRQGQQEAGDCVLGLCRGRGVSPARMQECLNGRAEGTAVT